MRFVASTCSATRACSSSVNEISASSRSPSPFGLIVVRSGPSPAKGLPPFDAWNGVSVGATVSMRSGRLATVLPPATSWTE
jgi:hypothetical protein